MNSQFTATGFLQSLSLASHEDQQFPFTTITLKNLDEQQFLQLRSHLITGINKQIQDRYKPRSFERRRAIKYAKNQVGPSFDEFLQILSDRHSKNQIPHTFQENTFSSYQRYLLHAFGGFWRDFLKKPFPFALPSKGRFRHSFLVGSSGSGKSQFIKLLALDELRRRNLHKKTGIILLDPHGDLAVEVARQNIFTHVTTKRSLYISDHLMGQILDSFERGPDGCYRQVRTIFSAQDIVHEWAIGKVDLVAPSMTLEANSSDNRLEISAIPLSDLIYLHPGLDPEGKHLFVMNPLDISGKRYNASQIAAYTQRLSSALVAMLGHESGALTISMQALIIPCLYILLNRVGSTILDLKRFLVDGSNEDLIALGKSSSNPVHAHFFQHDFSGGNFKPTRRSLSARLQVILNDPVIARILGSPSSSFDLERAMNEGKVVVMNLSGLGSASVEALGRFFIAMAFGFAVNRTHLATYKRIPVHCYVDEAGLFVGDDIEDILTTARKLGLHLTLSVQHVGQRMSMKLQQAILGNTEVKIVGKTGFHSQSIMSRNMNAKIENFQNLNSGEFLVKSGNLPFLRLQAIDTHLGLKTACSEDEWKRRQQFFLKRYYPSSDFQETVNGKNPNSLNTHNNQVEEHSRQNPDISGPKYTEEVF